MRTLVATHRTNGTADGDYDFCIEGEVVYMQPPCASDARDPDGPCGCGRGFSGMNSHRATTTALVVESPLSEDDVRVALRASLEAGGWIDPDVHTDAEVEPILDEVLGEVKTVAEHFAPGSVVRRRLSQYAERFPSPSR